MRAPISAVVAAACVAILASCSFVPPNVEPTFPVDYPIRHYFQSGDSASFAIWKVEVQAFRTKLREQYDAPGSTAPSRLSEPLEEKFLDEAVDPAKLIWKDPRLFWKTPVLLSWWEIVDERGRVTKVYVIASNQSKEMDKKVLAYCVNDKLWKAAELEGNPVISVRSASINLGESRYHISYWEKRASERPMTVALVLLITVGVLSVRHILKKRDREARHRALQAHVHPYHPKENDSDRPL